VTLALAKSPADWSALAGGLLAPPPAPDFWSWCRHRLRTYHGGKWDPRRARVARRFYRLVQARLSLRPCPEDPDAHRCEQLHLCFAGQIAKSMFLYSCLLYATRFFPRRIGLSIGRLKDLASVRKHRVLRMVERMPELDNLLPEGEEARERALGPDTWTIGAALVFWLCGSVADDLRMHDLPLILADESDTYPTDCDGYGDPLDLLLTRQRTYGRQRLFITASTPGVPTGHAWKRCAGEAASNERPLIQCPCCGGSSWLDPRQICLENGEDLISASPREILARQLARWECPWCADLLNADALTRCCIDALDADRWSPGRWACDADHPLGHWTTASELDGKGRLVHLAPCTGTIRSAHLSALWSLDVSLDRFAADWCSALRGTVENRKANLNSDHAEPWISTRTDATTDDLKAVAQPVATYAHGELPLATLGAAAAGKTVLLLCGDQQGNTSTLYNFPWVLRLHAAGGESWLVASGHAQSLAEWEALELRTWTIGGVPRHADLVSSDSGNGNSKWDMYVWASKAPQKRILIFGNPRLKDGIPWQEVTDSPGNRRRTPKPAQVREWGMAPHFWRTRLWQRIQGDPDLPRWWLPADPPPEYLKSMTSEEQILERRRVAGLGWVDQLIWRPRLLADVGDMQTFRTDTHWWDCEAHHCALSSILQLDQPIKPAAPVRYGVVGRFGAR
jgi:hypothetical protein